MARKVEGDQDVKKKKKTTSGKQSQQQLPQAPIEDEAERAKSCKGGEGNGGP